MGGRGRGGAEEKVGEGRREEREREWEGRRGEGSVPWLAFSFLIPSKTGTNHTSINLI